MRLAPIETPPTFMARIAYWATKRQLGKVIMPMKVINARMPKSFKLAWEMVKLAENHLSLDATLSFLIKSYVSILNDCAFCIDIAKAVAIQKHVSLEKFDALANFRTSPLYTDAERAALAYVEEATRNRRVSDETFAELQRHFSEQAIVEITFMNAMENYYNLLNLPLEIESDGLCSLAEQRAIRRAGASASTPATG